MFSAFEWMVAGRYLRARRAEGFISVIAGFSLLGIALGVGTLIVVLSVMNGFRDELLGRILGLNGHLVVQSVSGPVRGYDDLATRIGALEGVVSAIPIIDGQVMATANNTATGALVRGIRMSDLQEHTLVGDGISGAAPVSLDPETDVIIGNQLARRLGVRVGDHSRQTG